jgi:hypothetical protein
MLPEKTIMTATMQRTATRRLSWPDNVRTSGKGRIELVKARISMPMDSHSLAVPCANEKRG